MGRKWSRTRVSSASLPSQGVESIARGCSYMCLCEEKCRRRMENITGYRSQIMCSPGSVLLFVDGKEQIV